MPDRIRTGEGALPPPVNALFRRGEGYGWIRGCGVTLTDNTTDIEVRVGAGRVRAAGAAHDISATTKQLADGDGTYPRKDIIYVDYSGSVTVATGDPAPADPGDRKAEFTKSPAPPSGATLDGTLLAEVWVPAEATSSADLDTTDIADRRIADTGAPGTIPVEPQRPAEEDLTRTRWWYNEDASQFEAYIEARDEIVTFSTSTVTAFSGGTERIIETFEEDISGNWRDVESGLSYTTPAFEGSASQFLDGSTNLKEGQYSLPGDGLSYYAQPGDTIRLAVRLEADGHAAVGFAKDVDDNNGGYRALLHAGDDALRVLKIATDGSETTLGQTSVTVNQDTWYWVEVDYDGGGQGIHPARVYSTDTNSDPGTRDTQLASVGSPTADTDFRGRGYGIDQFDDGRVDYLTVLS